MPRATMLACAAVILCAAMASVSAQPAAGTNAPLRVGISPVFPPMVFKQGDEVAGVEVDLARAFGERLGRPVTFVEVPWPDQLETLSAGRTDIIMSSMSVTHARRYMASFTQPYFVVGQMALVRGENKNSYLLGFPPQPKGAIGVLKATTGEFLVQRDFPRAKRRVFQNGDDAAAAVAKKRVEFFIADSTLVWYLAGRYANDGLTVVPAMLSEEPLGWAVRKSDEELLQAANAFIQQSLDDGSLRKVFKRWTAMGD